MNRETYCAAIFCRDKEFNERLVKIILLESEASNTEVRPIFCSDPFYPTTIFLYKRTKIFIVFLNLESIFETSDISC